jgi:ABC-type lipoprotein export system ATPase subunit
MCLFIATHDQELLGMAETVIALKDGKMLPAAPAPAG